MFQFLHRQVGVNDGLADGVAEIGAGGHAQHPAVPHEGLAAKHRGRFFQGEDGKFLFRPFVLNFFQRAAADEIAFLHRNPETQPGFIGVVVGRDVRTPIQVSLFHAQGIDRPVADVGDAEVPARPPQFIVHPAGEFHRHVQLPPQFAHVTDADGANSGAADADFLEAGERQGFVADVVFGDAFKHLSRLWPAQVDHRPRRGDVADRHRAVAGDVGFNPVHVVDAEATAGDDVEPVFIQAADRQVRLDAALRIAQLGIDGVPAKLFIRFVEIGDGEALQGLEGAGAGDLELAERGLVDQRHPFAHRAVFFADLAEPVGAAEGRLVHRRDPFWREPVGPLPPGLGAIGCAVVLEYVIHGA